MTSNGTLKGGESLFTRLRNKVMKNKMFCILLFLSFWLICFVVLFGEAWGRNPSTISSSSSSHGQWSQYLQYDDMKQLLRTGRNPSVDSRAREEATVLSGGPADNSVTSGIEFKGEVIRHYPKSKLDGHLRKLKAAAVNAVASDSTTVGGKIHTSLHKNDYANDTSVCTNWAVVTTIFAPSEAIRRAVQLTHWCVVIVADKKSWNSERYMAATGWISDGDSGGGDSGGVSRSSVSAGSGRGSSNRDTGGNTGSPRVIYLTLSQQKDLHRVFPFVASMPVGSFARKNVGYLYAVLHGARFIWDFDDDNQLNFWSDGVQGQGQGQGQVGRRHLLTQQQEQPQPQSGGVRANGRDLFGRSQGRGGFGKGRKGRRRKDLDEVSWQERQQYHQDHGQPPRDQYQPKGVERAMERLQEEAEKGLQSLTLDALVNLLGNPVRGSSTGIIGGADIDKGEMGVSVTEVDGAVDISSYNRESGSIRISDSNRNSYSNSASASFAFNPYPVLGCPHSPCWPRGFPLDSIREESTFDVARRLMSDRISGRRVGIVQSLGDYQPDVDAIFRMTQETPFSFDTSPVRTTVHRDTRIEGRGRGRNRGREDRIHTRFDSRTATIRRELETEEEAEEELPIEMDIHIPNLLMVPLHAFTPLNAQAALHSYDAFWGLLLPSTVAGRVSDIWRSYLTQRIMWDTDLRVAFSSTVLVTQDRNVHSNMGDFTAETQLYKQSGAFLKFLEQWRSDRRTLPARILELWAAAYERGYIEEEDVDRVQLWLESLISAGYNFPDVNNQNALYGSSFNSSSTATTTTTTTTTTTQLRPVPVPVPAIAIKSTETTTKEPILRRKNRCPSHYNIPDLTFFFSDLHDGTRLDLSSLLSELGFRVILGGRKQNRTPWPDTPALKSGAIEIYGGMSPPLADLELHQQPLTLRDVQLNHDYYKHDPVLQSVDVFVCSFPASMCELWLGFNKTILFNPAHRYQIGRCDARQLATLNKHIYQWVGAGANSWKWNTPGFVTGDEAYYADHVGGGEGDRSASHKEPSQSSPPPPPPKHIIAAMSRYDKEYMRYYLGAKLPIHELYSSALGYLGEYSSTPIGRDAKSGQIIKLKREILAISTMDNRPMEQMIARTPGVVNIRTLYPHYSAEEVRFHRALIYYPLSVMSYKLTDFYALNIPIFIPSPLFAKENINADRDPYCPAEFARVIPPHPTNVHPYSPLETDLESTLYWYQMSDMLTWPHIIIFHSYEDLDYKLATTDFTAVSKQMVRENKRRRVEIEENLCASLEGVQTGRAIPEEFDSKIEMGL